MLFELLMRTGLWHSDADSNLSNSEDFRRLAQWTAADAREAVARITDRWAQARYKTKPHIGFASRIQCVDNNAQF